MVYPVALMLTDISEAPGSALPARHSLEVAEALRHPCGRWQVHSFPIILHLEPDGSSESPGNVQESFDDQSPFFLWDQHRSVSSKTAASLKVPVLPLCDLLRNTMLSSPAPIKLILPRKSEQREHASVHEAGTRKRTCEVFLPLLRPGPAKGRAGASTELLSQVSPRTPQVSGRHVHTAGRKHSLRKHAWPLVLG